MGIEGEEWEVWVVKGGGECKTTCKEEREEEKTESEGAALCNRPSQANFP